MPSIEIEPIAEPHPRKILPKRVNTKIAQVTSYYRKGLPVPPTVCQGQPHVVYIVYLL